MFLFPVPLINSGAAVYAGPGDVVSSATAWWGLRAYASASIGTAAIRLREDSGNTEQDFATGANGGLNMSAISTFAAGANLYVVKLYNQGGGGSTNDLVQATAANQPLFNTSDISIQSPTEIAGSTTVRWLATAGDLVGEPISQPFTWSAVCLLDSSEMGSSNSFNGQSGSGGFVTITTNAATPNKFDLFAGSHLTTGTTIADTAWHAVQAVFNGASSDLVIDGASNSGNAGANTLQGQKIFFGLNNTPAQPWGRNGATSPSKGREWGIWSLGFSAGNKTSVNSNQHTYWSF